MIKKAVKKHRRARVEILEGLLVEFVERESGIAILRGLRAISDFEYELQMAHMNRRLKTDIETVFMMPSEEYSFITSSIIKEVAALGGSMNGLVPKNVEIEIKQKF